jgi:hypothetical protein
MKRGLSLLIDNTTLHRLEFALNGSAPRRSPAELANILHLLECLVLADNLIVNGFESAGSNEHSEAILDWLSHSHTPELVTVSPHSDEYTQMSVATAVALEMDERGLLMPDGEGTADLAAIDVTLGRPRDVVEIADSFWRAVATGKLSHDLIREQAHAAVAEHRTDGLFVYGLAQHGDLVERVNHALRHTRRLTGDEWKQTHVIFRALFNQRFAELHDERTYAPPPVRAGVLRAVYSRPLAFLSETFDVVAYDAHIDLNNTTFAEELMEYTPKPLPLLGLCYMLEADEPRIASFGRRLYAARTLAAPMRAQLSELEGLARRDPPRYFERLRAEADGIDQVARKRLGLGQSTGLDLTFDAGVTVNPETGAPTFGMKLNPKAAIRRASRAIERINGHQRISVLSDGLSRTLTHSTVEQAVRRAVRST